MRSINQSCHAVRRRIAAGDDIIKFFAGYRRHMMRSRQHPCIPSVLHSPKELNPGYTASSQEEINGTLPEAALIHATVSTHCGTLECAVAPIKAGVEKLEHVCFTSDEILTRMEGSRIILVPTRAVAENHHAACFPWILKQVKRAHDMGIRLACGGDTETYPRGDNVRELEPTIEAGIPVPGVLELCPVGGWEAGGGDLSGRRFSWIEQGLQTDIIALNHDPQHDINALRSVDFGTKYATAWKMNSRARGMH
ncbi:hypothetical protein BJY00DRAFT_310476 [Aspergillus carlsbadensis]|nr:hypothetical protein BJY00DRAFT_310476 [Aspergillus carlsbadensis]